MNILWHSLAGKPVPDIAAALREMPVLVPREGSVQPASVVFGDDSPWFEYQAMNLHRLDPDALAAVLARPDSMLEGYEPEELLPRIECPVLLVQADPAAGGALSDAAVQMALRLLRHSVHVKLEGMDHTLHSLPAQTPRVAAAVTPFLDSV
jgi:pimeloyl-ACP methyl ester carboxylesterase